MEKSDVFRIAGSVSNESEEELLGHVLKVVGYTSNIHRLVKKSFNYCETHKVATPRAPKARMPRASALCSCPPLGGK
jgi:hypothetical protein